MIQHCVDSVHHKPGNMRNTGQDEVAVGTDQASHLYVAVENTQVVTFADQVLDDLDHRTFAQIVGSRFETESKNTNFPLALFGYQSQSFGHLQLIAGEDCIHDREVQIVHFGFVGQGSKVFGQAGTAERETRHQVSGGDVQLFILAENLHDLMRIDSERLAKIANFIREADF